MATQHVLALGDRLPTFELPGTDGTRYSPQSFRESKVLVVLFLANHCPYVQAWEDRIVAIARDYAREGAAFVAISSNDVAAYPADAPDNMAERARDKQYPFPYLYDEDQSVAHEFSAVRTPEAFVFDQDRRLQYHGAVDSDYEESGDTINYLRDALVALLQTGGSIFQQETPVVGCTIKWKE